LFAAAGCEGKAAASPAILGNSANPEAHKRPSGKVLITQHEPSE